MMLAGGGVTPATLVSALQLTCSMLALMLLLPVCAVLLCLCVVLLLLSLITTNLLLLLLPPTSTGGAHSTIPLLAALLIFQCDLCTPLPICLSTFLLWLFTLAAWLGRRLLFIVCREPLTEEHGDLALQSWQLVSYYDRHLNLPHLIAHLVPESERASMCALSCSHACRHCPATQTPSRMHLSSTST